MRKRLMLLAVFGLLLAFVTVGFAPVAQGIQRFRTIYTDNVRVSNSATINTLTVTGDQTNAGDLTVTGDLALTGGMSGNVLIYPTPGVSVFCDTSTVTGTLELTASTHLMATPIAAQCTLAQDVTGASYNCSYLNSTGIITLSVFGNQATPVASSAGAEVTWCVTGTQ